MVYRRTHAITLYLLVEQLPNDEQYHQTILAYSCYKYTQTCLPSLVCNCGESWDSEPFPLESWCCAFWVLQKYWQNNKQISTCFSIYQYPAYWDYTQKFLFQFLLGSGKTGVVPRNWSLGLETRLMVKPDVWITRRWPCLKRCAMERVHYIQVVCSFHLLQLLRA